MSQNCLDVPLCITWILKVIFFPNEVSFYLCCFALELRYRFIWRQMWIMSSCRYSQSISACWYFVEWSTKIEKVNINKNHSFLIPYILSQNIKDNIRLSTGVIPTTESIDLQICRPGSIWRHLNLFPWLELVINEYLKSQEAVFAMRIPYTSISLLRQKMQIPHQSRDLSLGILVIDTQRWGIIIALTWS